MLNFAKHDEQALLEFLNHLGRRDAVLDYHQIQGLLYAMACSPEPIAPSEWFELIWLNDEPQFDDVGEARAFFRLLTELAQDIGETARRECYRPAVGPDGTRSVAALADWCDGFLTGHRYLEDIWLVALDALDDDDLYEQVATTLDLAAAFAGGDAVEWSADGDDDLQAVCLQFQQLLGEYYAVHRRYAAGVAPRDVLQEFAALAAVGRDEPCPCGSGRAFGRCCLH